MNTRKNTPQFKQPISEEIWGMKYQYKNFDGSVNDVTVEDTWSRVGNALAINEEEHKKRSLEFYNTLYGFKFLPAGRITAGSGTGRSVTLMNCYVMNRIEDSMTGIFDTLKESALTMQQGGGIGMDFSTIRPKGAEVKGVNADASGPLSFMEVWDSMCKTVMSAGSRRGAMMATMRCDHPDIEDFIDSKLDRTKFRMFNMSVLCTDPFMEAVANDADWNLVFGGKVYRTVKARDLWYKIMKGTYEKAEPGVIFIDRITAKNNLDYCEDIIATNPSMPAGTMVHTKDGIVPIETLEDKEFFVKSLDGKWAKAKCFLSSDSAEVLEIDFGGGKTVRSTKEHRWPVQVNGRYLKSYTSDLREGDRIPLNLNERLGLNNRNDLGYVDGLVAGIVFGDGSYNVRSDDGRAYISVHCNKLDFDLQQVVAEYFNVSAKPQNDEVVLNVTRDSVVRSFIEKVGLTLGDKSKLPSPIWTSNDLFVAGFIDGLFSTDGCVHDSSSQSAALTFTNKNSDVCREVALMLAFHGINSNIRTSTQDSFGSTFERTDVTINHGNALKFSRLFNLTCLRKQGRLDEHLRFTKRDHVSSTHQVVKSVTSVGNHRVWDISVFHNEHVFPSEWCYTGNCGEVPLPPYGACLLGSINLPMFVIEPFTEDAHVDYDEIREVVFSAVRMMDNVIDVTNYPLPEQKAEAQAKRRIGLGVTGLASMLAMLRMKYGSQQALGFVDELMGRITNYAYMASAALAKERGPFPLYDANEFDPKVQLPDYVRDTVKQWGLRNGTVLSIAPTGTISLYANNVSSGIEPIFATKYDRKVLLPDGSHMVQTVKDYAVYLHEHYYPGVPLPEYFQTTADLTPEDHILMQATVQKYVCQSISKTVNLPEDISFSDFADVYAKAYYSGCKGCTTYRPNSNTGSILSVSDDSTGGDDSRPVDTPDEGAACTYDATTGRYTCDQ